MPLNAAYTAASWPTFSFHSFVYFPSTAVFLFFTFSLTSSTISLFISLCLSIFFFCFLSFYSLSRLESSSILLCIFATSCFSMSTCDLRSRTATSRFSACFSSSAFTSFFRRSISRERA